MFPVWKYTIQLHNVELQNNAEYNRIVDDYKIMQI